MSERKQVLSCMQPTGDAHLGNYFGAVKNWVDLQEKYDCKYGLVNYHAMTAPYNAAKMRQNTWDMALDVIALGVHTKNLFIQSLIPEHAELGWIFSCMASYGELTRMTQFKDKSEKIKSDSKDSHISAGLFGYPVLQAADILIYRADYVPVGQDQDQHMELTRHIAHRFNTQFGKEYFVMPEGLHTKLAKVLSTADPNKKMSKSLGEKHFIRVFASAEEIRRKIGKAVTDMGAPDPNQMSAGVQNLFDMLKASGNQEAYDSLKESYQQSTLSYKDLKETVADSLIAMNTPFIEKRAELKANKKAVKEEIKQASFEIRKVARQTLKEVHELTGLIYPK